MNSFLCCAHPDLHKLRQLANSVRKTQKKLAGIQTAKQQRQRLAASL